MKITDDFPIELLREVLSFSGNLSTSSVCKEWKEAWSAIEIKRTFADLHQFFASSLNTSIERLDHEYGVAHLETEQKVKKIWASTVEQFDILSQMPRFKTTVLQPEEHISPYHFKWLQLANLYFFLQELGFADQTTDWRAWYSDPNLGLGNLSEDALELVFINACCQGHLPIVRQILHSNLRPSVNILHNAARAAFNNYLFTAIEADYRIIHEIIQVIPPSEQIPSQAAWTLDAACKAGDTLTIQNLINSDHLERVQFHELEAALNYPLLEKKHFEAILLAFPYISSKNTISPLNFIRLLVSAIRAKEIQPIDMLMESANFRELSQDYFTWALQEAVKSGLTNVVKRLTQTPHFEDISEENLDLITREALERKDELTAQIIIKTARFQRASATTYGWALNDAWENNLSETYEILLKQGRYEEVPSYLQIDQKRRKIT